MVETSRPPRRPSPSSAMSTRARATARPAAVRSGSDSGSRTVTSVLPARRNAGERAVDEDDAGADRSRKRSRRALVAGRDRPLEDGAVRVGRVGGRHYDKLCLLGWRSQRSQHVQRRGPRELRGGHAADEVAAADAAAVLHGPQHGIDGRETARNSFARHDLARQHAVPHEQLIRDGGGPHGRRESPVDPRGDQRPAAFSRRRDESSRSEDRAPSR